MNIVSAAKTWTNVESGEFKDADEVPLTALQKAMVAVAVILPFVALISTIPLLWGWGVTTLDLVLFVVFYALSVLGVTVGFHRLFTHKAFETVRPIRAALAIFGSIALQGPVIKWAAVHRRHHQCADHDGDPHSPHLHGNGMWSLVKGMWHAHVGWTFHSDPANLGRSVRDLMADRTLMFIDKAFLLWVVLGVVLPGVIGGLISQSWIGVFTGVLWGGLVRICLMHHVTWSINSVCHVFGTRPFKSDDHSTNNFPIAIVSFGEGWHNNHHAFPTSARHGLRWWQVDISWMFIWVLQKLRLAWNVRLPSPAAMAAKTA